MRRLRLTLVGTVIVALLGGLSSVVLAQDEADADALPASVSESPSPVFPTGQLVSVDNARWMLEFDEGGTGKWHDVTGASGWTFTYAVDGDVLTWSTDPFHSLSEPAGGPKHFDDATYRWDYDGERLAFELLGDDPSDRREALLLRTYRPIEDPRVVMVAISDIDVGGAIRAWSSFVPAAEVGPDAYTSKVEYLGHVAAVPISMGQPITPDLVTPAE